MSAHSVMPLSLRLALRDLRSGLAGFRIFLACLAIGVGAIAAVGSVNQALHQGLASNGRALLGGDLSVRLSYRPPDPSQLASLQDLGETTSILEMRTMARTADLTSGAPMDESRNLLIQFKAVEPNYPLVDQMVLVGGGNLHQALADGPDGIPGAVVGPTFPERLGVNVGELVRVGDAVLRITGIIDTEPDDLAGGMGLRMGPRLMVRTDVAERSGLLQPGTLVEYFTPVLFHDPNLTVDEAKETLERQHPDAGWRVRGPSEAGLSFQNFIDQLTLFLTLVGLMALLVGGIGIANAVKAHLDSRLETIAVLKSVGASTAQVFRVYFGQIVIIALVGILIGLAIGACAPLAMVALADGELPLPKGILIYPEPLLQAALFGVLVTIAFALGPLTKAELISPALLFRNDVEAPDPRLRPIDILWIGVVSALLIGLIILTAHDRNMAALFIAASLGAFTLFRLIAWVVTLIARHTRPPAGYPALRLAFASLGRSGGPTVAVMLSLGLGLSVLVSIALVERSLSGQISGGLPKDAPSYYFIDVQPDQVERLRTDLLAIDPAMEIHMTDQVRGRIQALNGEPVDVSKVKPSAQWAVQSDRGFTTSATLPDGSVLLDGAWWPADYNGPPLFSITADMADGMGLKIGDTITVNILGRDITGTLAAIRKVQWMSLRMNFSFVVSPNAFAGAPATWIVTAHTEPTHLTAIENTVSENYRNVSLIDVREVLSRVRGILNKIALSVNVTAILTLICGLLVLAGAFAATHRRRILEAVTLKVLGATRKDVLRAYALEYGTLGINAGIVAAVVGSVSAWAIVTFMLDYQFTFYPGTVIACVVLCLVVSLAGGFVGTARALSLKAAPYLREE